MSHWILYHRMPRNPTRKKQFHRKKIDTPYVKHQVRHGTKLPQSKYGLLASQTAVDSTSATSWIYSLEKLSNDQSLDFLICKMEALTEYHLGL